MAEDLVKGEEHQPNDAPAWLRWVGWFIDKVGVPGAALGAVLYILASYSKDTVGELRQIRTVLEERLPKKDMKDARAMEEHASAEVNR